MMPNYGNVKEINKGIEDKEYNPYDFFTTSALEDDLIFHLSSKCKYQIDAETKVIHLDYKYLNYAEHILYRINVLKPAPKFEISRQDIPQKLEQYLIKLDTKTITCILTNVVRRILESVDPVYYHTNGIHGKVRWRIID